MSAASAPPADTAASSSAQSCSAVTADPVIWIRAE
jgi:hypothetical protein